MKQIMMKAKAGVTLVELLVVILIVTILSVSLLPLLKPYIEEAKYAAEPIPVLANLQTKIELYQYEKDKLPELNVASLTNGTATWYYDSNVTTGNQYVAIACNYDHTGVPNNTNVDPSGHIQQLLDVDWQDFTGKRMRPNHFQYVVTDNTGPSRYCYAVAVVGDGTGLGVGTGYAVCKIVNAELGKKVVGTWKKYKATHTAQYQLRMCDSVSNKQAPDGVIPVPDSSSLGSLASVQAWDNMISGMEALGWEF